MWVQSGTLPHLSPVKQTKSMAGLCGEMMGTAPTASSSFTDAWHCVFLNVSPSRLQLIIVYIPLVYFEDARYPQIYPHLLYSQISTPILGS